MTLVEQTETEGLKAEENESRVCRTQCWGPRKILDLSSQLLPVTQWGTLSQERERVVVAGSLAWESPPAYYMQSRCHCRAKVKISVVLECRSRTE